MPVAIAAPMRSASFAMSSPSPTRPAAPRRDHPSEAVHAARLLAVDPHGRVEVLQLAGGGREVVRVELLDLGRAGLTGEEVRPGRLDVVAERGDHPEAGHDHAPSPFSLPIYIPSPPSTSSTSPVMNEARRSEEAYRPGHVLRIAEPSERRVVEHRVRRLLGQHVRQLRLHVAGRDDVRAHIAGAELAGERP